MPGVVLDTGPLVAYLYPRDRHHRWAVEQFVTLDLPFVTCEPVITEACFLLARNGLSAARVLETIERGVVKIGLQLSGEAAALREAVTRYANVRMALADACLVRLAEITEMPICTLDSDFEIYRTHRRRALNLISPSGGVRSLHEP